MERSRSGLGLPLPRIEVRYDRCRAQRAGDETVAIDGRTEVVAMHPPPPISKTSFDRVLYAFSIITILMTIPQVLSVWMNRSAEGVSLITWGTYLVSACVWLVHGLKQRDPTIYRACIAWILLDAAIVVGALVYG